MHLTPLSRGAHRRPDREWSSLSLPCSMRSGHMGGTQSGPWFPPSANPGRGGTGHCHADLGHGKDMVTKGLCKVKKNPKKNWIELTHQLTQFCFGNPSLTWTENSNHNNQQLFAMHILTEYTWYTTPKYQYRFRAILGQFSQKKIPSGPTHPLP